VPDEVREMIVSQARRLSPGDRDVLEAASVAGMKVDTDILARAIARDPEEVDEVARRLVWPHQFLDALDDPSDDERGRHYQFVHGLHRHVLYERLPVARRRRFHQSIAIAYAEHALGLLRRHAEQRTAHPSAQLAAISSLPRVRPCWRMLCDSCS
jgi:predicted ATPase